MWKKLKIRYGLTDYQIALLRYLLFTFLSESSKLFLILFLYRKHLALLYPAYRRRISLQYICRLSVCKHRLCFFVSDAFAFGFSDKTGTAYIVHGLYFDKLCACTCFLIKKACAFCHEKETV